MPEQRRLVTILFADVAGSTELGETLDPEDIRVLLARFYAIARGTVAAHGGTLEKFIGDAVMAIFGFPVAHGDDAARAISAALELRDTVRSDPSLGERLPVRFGLNTGEVVATREPAADDFLVTGDAVNAAARLQQAAEPWQVLCGARTAHAAAREFCFEPLERVQAKGKRDGVSAAVVVGRAVSRRTRIPLVGREVDLAQLELAARRAFEERRPSLVSVVAPAGVGKTRLLEEFLDRLSGNAPASTIAIAQCLPYGQRLTYWPLRAVLFSLAGIDERAVPSEVREYIRNWLRDSTLANAEQVADLLAATVGAGEFEGEVTDRTALLVAWRSALEYAAHRGPLVVVFEDLHWSSDSLLDVVEFVLQPRSDVPLLVITLTRPELLDRRPNWGGGRRNYVALTLEPLPDGAVARIIGHLLGSNRPEIVARLVKVAEGNPFFAGELVRTLLDRVPSFDDTPAVERALATLPDTVQATVLARLDLLGPETRRVLQLGAVLGRTFRATGVAALEPAIGDLSTHLEVLLDKDLIRSSDSEKFVFRHILIREVAYQTLSRAERVRLHAAAGRWLEEFAAGREEAFAELIAYHYGEAASLAASLTTAATDASATRERATTWLVRASEVAQAGAAQQEAARHLRTAIMLAEREMLPALYEKLGDVNISGESADHYRMSLRLFREQGGREPNRELRLLAGTLGVLTRMQGSMSERPSRSEIATLRAEGFELLAHATDERAIAHFLTANAFHPFWNESQGTTPEELDAAESSARRALEIVTRLGDSRMQSAALDAVGSTLMLRGNMNEARDVERRRLTLRDLDLIELIDAWYMDAWTSVLLGDLDAAIRVSGDGLAAVQPGQAPIWALRLAAWYVEALALRGRWDEMLAGGERMLRLWDEAEHATSQAALRGFLKAFTVARARRNDAVAERLRDAIREMSKNIREPSPGGLLAATILSDATASDATLLRSIRTADMMNVLDSALSYYCDREIVMPDGLLDEIEVVVRRFRLPLPNAQLDRAIGITRRDAARLGQALAAFEGCRAVPYAARARVECAFLTVDAAEYAAGIRSLEALGDWEQLERYERRKRD